MSSVFKLGRPFRIIKNGVPIFKISDFVRKAVMQMPKLQKKFKILGFNCSSLFRVAFLKSNVRRQTYYTSLHAVCLTKLGYMQNISMGERTGDLFIMKADNGNSKNTSIKANDQELLVLRIATHSCLHKQKQVSVLGFYKT